MRAIVLLFLFITAFSAERFYEHDAQGWLVGWHTDAARPSSTNVAPAMLPSRARWNGSTWVTDTSRETQAEIDREADRARLRAARQKCREYNPDTATAADVRVTLAAALYLLRESLKEE